MLLLNDRIREQAVNWKDYFSFWALYLLTGEGDVLETPLVNDGFIYRVDTTDAFPINDEILFMAGINVELDGIVPNAFWKERLLSFTFDHLWDVKHFDDQLGEFAHKYGKECIIPFLEPFERIQDISADYIDDFLNTLCYFYPDVIGDFFNKYLDALRKFSQEYLKTKRSN